jgi:hypothetical protein
MIYYFANIIANTLHTKLHDYQVAFVNTFESEEHDKNYIKQVLFRLEQRTQRLFRPFYEVAIRWQFLLSMPMSTDNDPQNIDTADKILEILTAMDIGFPATLEISDQPLGIARNGNYLHSFVVDANYSIDVECYEALMNGTYKPDTTPVISGLTLKFDNILN